MSKTLENLVDKAIDRGNRNGTGVAQLKNPYRNGQVSYFGKNHEGTFNAENRWKVVASKTPGDWKVSQVLVYHYDTLIANIESVRGSWQLNNWYAESPTDRDALNYLASRFSLEQSFVIRKGEVKEVFSV